MSQEQEKEILQLKNRFLDLAEKAYSQNIFTFTSFLGLNEQDIFWQVESKLQYAGHAFWGGTENADRKMIRFGNEQELGYSMDFPIVCIYIKPVAVKFADALTHRDFLGALMNLGIDRSTLGDIKVGEKEAYLFCNEGIAEFICENLVMIKHTHVTCQKTQHYKEILQEEPPKQVIAVASPRIDAVIAKVYHQSRSEGVDLFRTKKVIVDGRLCENNARLLKGGEVINARGFGKFKLWEIQGETKKGKVNILVAVYR